MPKNTENQEEEFKPFDPDLDASTQPMQIIANLPNMKEGEFNHEYMAQHSEQLQMDLTLCLKCSPATKYFCSPRTLQEKLPLETEPRANIIQTHKNLQHIDDSLLPPSASRDYAPTGQTERTGPYKKSVPIPTRKQGIHTHS